MLGMLKRGDRGIITDTSETDQLVRRRLMDFGILEGTEVCIKCIMPFGGPLMVEASGQCVGIRRHEACRIRVTRL